MKKRLILMLAAVLVAQPAGARRAAAMTQTAERAAAAAPVQVLPICEKALAAAIDGHDALAVVKDAVKDLPEPQQQQVLGVCGVYLLGAVSMLKHAREAAPLPAGGTSI
jgi:hypothetical protein